MFINEGVGYRASLTLPFTYIYDEKMLKHKPQKGDVERPEKPDRLTTILETFKDFGVDKRLVRTKVITKHLLLNNYMLFTLRSSSAIGLTTALIFPAIWPQSTQRCCRRLICMSTSTLMRLLILPFAVS